MAEQEDVTVDWRDSEFLDEQSIELLEVYAIDEFEPGEMTLDELRMDIADFLGLDIDDEWLYSDEFYDFIADLYPE
jgi:hypothetical protein